MRVGTQCLCPLRLCLAGLDGARALETARKPENARRPAALCPAFGRECPQIRPAATHGRRAGTAGGVFRRSVLHDPGDTALWAEASALLGGVCGAAGGLGILLRHGPGRGRHIRRLSALKWLLSLFCHGSLLVLGLIVTGTESFTRRETALLPLGVAAVAVRAALLRPWSGGGTLLGTARREPFRCAGRVLFDCGCYDTAVGAALPCSEPCEPQARRGTFEGRARLRFPLGGLCFAFDI